MRVNNLKSNRKGVVYNKNEVETMSVLRYKRNRYLKRIILPIMLGAVVLFGLTGCGTDNIKGNEVESIQEMETITYTQISADEAKSLMEKESDYRILDVRTETEFAEGHIPNAVLIPDYEIEAKAEAIITDKEQLILVYCRSGRRSKNAAKQLAAMGYSNVKEFGGIIDWPYEITTK
jgi:rhodanese-related sulfurtransferase